MKEQTKAPSYFSEVFSNLKTMSKEDESLVEQALCPICILRMPLLGDFGPIRGFQCGRCRTIYVVSTTPNPRSDG